MHKMNGWPHFSPSGPDAILFHLAETQGKQTEQIANLITRVSRLEQSRPPFPWRDLWPMAAAAIGFILVLAGKMSAGDVLALLGRG